MAFGLNAPSSPARSRNGMLYIWETREELHPIAPDFLKRSEAYRKSGLEELAHLELSIGTRLASLTEKVALGEWYQEQGNYFTAVRLGIAAFRERPCPRTYRLAYPRPFLELVLQAAEDYRLDPYLLLAVMREESQFRPDAVSRAGARGLM